ncbi:MAG: hypothetical protein KF817_03760 [Phycisphaeraceae bacterium]|nr:hypothetical protein [Phycisphaeraceae bacterium]
MAERRVILALFAAIAAGCTGPQPVAPPSSARTTDARALITGAVDHPERGPEQSRRDADLGLRNRDSATPDALARVYRRSWDHHHTVNGRVREYSRTEIRVTERTARPRH